MAKKQIRIRAGDCRQVLRRFPDNSVDSMVTDPPAGIGFMNYGFDSNRGGRDQWIAWLTPIIEECVRVLRPGAHALVWAIPRTSHWTAMALENGGLEIRDSVHHLFGTGWPKGLAIDKAIDKIKGAKRRVVATKKAYRRISASPWRDISGFNAGTIKGTAPATADARKWHGWNTSLKPGHEVWWLCRKPLGERSVAANVLDCGTGAINVGVNEVGEKGRYPTNLVLSHSPRCSRTECAPECLVFQLDCQAGWRKSGKMRGGLPLQGGHINGRPSGVTRETYGDEGGVSRFYPTFYYSPKASRKDRGQDNDHPTVKNTELMRWLCRLITPPGGTVLDPFMGSGSTAVACQREGFSFIGIEQESHYVEIARRRVKQIRNEECGALAM